MWILDIIFVLQVTFCFSVTPTDWLSLVHTGYIVSASTQRKGLEFSMLIRIYTTKVVGNQGLTWEVPSTPRHTHTSAWIVCWQLVAWGSLASYHQSLALFARSWSIVFSFVLLGMVHFIHTRIHHLSRQIISWNSNTFAHNEHLKTATSSVDYSVKGVPKQRRC